MARIPVAQSRPGGLFVGSTPVLSLDQLRGEPLAFDDELGELRRETAKARVWVKGRLISVQWPRLAGGWIIITQYRVPAR